MFVRARAKKAYSYSGCYIKNMLYIVQKSNKLNIHVSSVRLLTVFDEDLKSNYYNKCCIQSTFVDKNIYFDKNKMTEKFNILEKFNIILICVADMI